MLSARSETKDDELFDNSEKRATLKDVAKSLKWHGWSFKDLRQVLFEREWWRLVPFANALSMVASRDKEFLSCVGYDGLSSSKEIFDNLRARKDIEIVDIANIAVFAMFSPVEYSKFAASILVALSMDDKCWMWEGLPGVLTPLNGPL